MSRIDQEEILLKANKKLSWGILGFLALIPLVIILYIVKILPYTFEDIIIVCSCILFFSVLPFFVNKFFYNESFIAHCNLYCLELLVLMLIFNPVVDLSLLYFVLPIVSLIYLNRGILHKMSMIAFAGMILVKGSKLGYSIASDKSTAIDFNPMYMDLLVSTIEFIVLSR